MKDEINPDHYRVGGLECIDVIEKLGLPHHLASAFAYIWRAGRKTEDDTSDVKKAIWFLERYLKINTTSIIKGDLVERMGIKPRYMWLPRSEWDPQIHGPGVSLSNETSANMVVDELNRCAHPVSYYFWSTEKHDWTNFIVIATAGTL